MADSETGSPHSYSTFMVTIVLSRLVSEILVCDRQTYGRTTRTTAIAAPYIVASQLIIAMIYVQTSCGILWIDISVDLVEYHLPAVCQARSQSYLLSWRQVVSVAVDAA